MINEELEMARYTSCIDLHLILRDEQGRVLLGQRQNTGWADGLNGLPSGHLEDGEAATVGAAREAEEETGVLIKTDTLRLVHVMHHRTDSGRMALFFEASDWAGEITNTEPDKCAGWTFHDPAQLDDQMVPYIGKALRHIASGEFYSEGGWSQP
jgi:8-oxo-dGTP diphosphatase